MLKSTCFNNGQNTLTGSIPKDEATSWYETNRNHVFYIDLLLSLPKVCVKHRAVNGILKHDKLPIFSIKSDLDINKIQVGSRILASNQICVR